MFKIGAARSQLNGETIDKLCACCQGAVPQWGAPPEEEAVMGHGWCSYCLTRNSFTLVQKNYLEYGPLPPLCLLMSGETHRFCHHLRRNDYECDGCRRSACFCINCGKAYTRGSAALCVKCEGSITNWTKYDDVRALFCFFVLLISRSL